LKISVEMIAYNAGPLIEAAIKSTYDYVDEIIVVDGSQYGPSTDDTLMRATSCGPKVKALIGKFGNKFWDEASQRRCAENQMEQGPDNWILYQDADEVWFPDYILRLREHLEKAPPEVINFSVRAIHFFLDPLHVITGPDWEKWRPDMVRRNSPGSDPHGLRMHLDDVSYHHYGPALPKSRRTFRLKQYCLRGDYVEAGFGHEDYERLVKHHDDCENTIWMDREKTRVLLWAGPYHPDVVRLSELIWGIQL